MRSALVLADGLEVSQRSLDEARERFDAANATLHGSVSVHHHDIPIIVAALRVAAAWDVYGALPAGTPVDGGGESEAWKTLTEATLKFRKALATPQGHRA